MFTISFQLLKLYYIVRYIFIQFSFRISVCKCFSRTVVHHSRVPTTLCTHIAKLQNLQNRFSANSFAFVYGLAKLNQLLHNYQRILIVCRRIVYTCMYFVFTYMAVIVVLKCHKISWENAFRQEILLMVIA